MAGQKIQKQGLSQVCVVEVHLSLPREVITSSLVHTKYNYSEFSGFGIIRFSVYLLIYQSKMVWGWFENASWGSFK